MPWGAVSTQALRQEFLTLAAQATISLSELCRRFGAGRSWRGRSRYAGWRARGAAGAMCLGLALGGWPGPAEIGAAAPPRPERRAPAIGQGPTEVDAGFYLISISKVNELDETFDIDGHLYLRWKDEGQAWDPATGGPGPRELALEEVWWPRTAIFNARNDRVTSHVRLLAWPDGRMLYRERFGATVLSDMDLRRFPFDSQVVRIEVRSFAFDIDTVGLRPAADLIGHNAEFTMDSWRLGGSRGRVAEPRADPDGSVHSRFVYEVELHRRYEFYVWKVFLPLLLIVGMSWALFWLESGSLSTSMSVGATSMLAAIAFNFAVAGSLPRLSYMTLMDGFIFTCYTAIFLSLVLDVRVWRLHRGGQDKKAERVDRACRWLFPACFGLTCLLLFGWFLWR